MTQTNCFAYKANKTQMESFITSLTTLIKVGTIQRTAECYKMNLQNLCSRYVHQILLIQRLVLIQTNGMEGYPSNFNIKGKLTQMPYTQLVQYYH